MVAADRGQVPPTAPSCATAGDALGGRTAEELVFGEITTGAANDIEKATEIARAMVTEYGMSEKLGPRSSARKHGEVFLGRDMGHEPDYSDEVAARDRLGFHGFGGEKRGFADKPPHEGPRRLAQRGIAVLNYTSRGFHGSCGTLEARGAQLAACARGWLHLDDVRYEIRDAQYLAGRLVDEGLVDPQRLGAFADSYGGEPTIFLGLLRDRMVLGALPGEPDGKLVPWTSPKGRPMQVRAIAPYQTWADLPHVLVPNGRLLDYVDEPLDASATPLGVLKAAFVAGLLATGQISTSTFSLQGYFAPPGIDPDSDLTSWTVRLAAGEPYEGDPTVAAMRDASYRWRSPIRVPLDRQPAAMILGSGWADDLFPVDEMIRLRARIQAAWPDTPIGVYLADFGHQRTGNEQADVDERNEWFMQLFDHELLGKGPRPGLGFRARAVTCPVGNGSGPLHTAPTWAALHPGEVRYRAPGTKTVTALGGDPLVSLEFTPLTANEPCKTVAAADAGAGAASYRLPAATGDGYTLLGAPTVIAALDVTGVNAQLAARLWDVSPDGRQLLVTRQVLRPRGGGTPEPFQLQPAGWHVAAGHVLKLELLGNDAPHYRPSNGIFTIAVRDLDLRLPVADQPGAGPVTAPAAALMPSGARRAADLPPPRRLAAHVTYPSCRVARIRVTGPAIASVRVGRRRDAKRPFVLRVARRGTTLHAAYADAPTRVLRVRVKRC
jgi:hypothetical protein